MSQGTGSAFRADAQRSLAFGSVVAGYAAIGLPLDRASRMMIVTNYTDALLQFSFDGLIDHFVMMPYTQHVLDVGSNQEGLSMYYLQSQTQLSVKRIGTPTVGNVYVSIYYARGD